MMLGFPLPQLLSEGALLGVNGKAFPRIPSSEIDVFQKILSFQFTKGMEQGIDSGPVPQSVMSSLINRTGMRADQKTDPSLQDQPSFPARIACHIPSPPSSLRSIASSLYEPEVLKVEDSASGSQGSAPRRDGGEKWYTEMAGRILVKIPVSREGFGRGPMEASGGLKGSMLSGMEGIGEDLSV